MISFKCFQLASLSFLLFEMSPNVCGQGRGETPDKETVPTLILKPPKLLVKHRNVSRKNGNYRIPGVYDRLEYQCNSTMPTEWVYQGQVPGLKVWKQRSVNQTHQIFSSQILFEHGNDAELEPFNLTCRNLCGAPMCRNSSVRVNDSHQIDLPYYDLRIVNDVNVLPPVNQTRESCDILLNVNQVTGEYECIGNSSSSDGHEASSRIIPCGNPDECRLRTYRQEQDCSGSRVTFSNSCLTEWCFAPLDSFHSFVIVCGSRNFHLVVSQSFFRPLEGRKAENESFYMYDRHVKNYEGIQTRISSLELQPVDPENPWDTCKNSENPGLICMGESRLFRCTALKSLFTFGYGFFWTIRGYDNKSQPFIKELGHGEEWVDPGNSSVIFSDMNVTFPLDLNVTEVMCSASLWNSFDWVNTSLAVNVTRARTPAITQLLQIVPGKGQGQGQVFRCQANAWPQAHFVWNVTRLGDMGKNNTQTSKPCANPETFSKRNNNNTDQEHCVDLENMDKSNDWDNVNYTDRVSELRLFISLPSDKDVWISCIVWSFGEMDQRTIFIPAAPGGRAVEIMVAILTGVFSLFLLIALFFSCRKIRRQKEELRGLSPEELDEFRNGNPNGSEAFLLPYNMDLEIPRDQIIMGDKILGSGAFGQVVEGKMGIMTVAVKTVKKTADVIYLKSLMCELKVLSYVGRHPNIVNLLGSCTQNINKREILVVLEYCEQGNMLTLLRQCRGIFIDHLEKNSAETERKSMVEYQNAAVKKLSSKDLMRWAYEIACGMEFLASKNVIHGDLAARNILITGDLNAKVSDFGLAKQVYEYTIYVQHINIPLPLRWMSYEALKDLEFSIQSDIWSFGIVLWELFSLGEVPYPGLDWGFEAHTLIQQGQRNEKPAYASDYMYTLMCGCWEIDPKARPAFKFLKESINDHRRIFGKNPHLLDLPM